MSANNSPGGPKLLFVISGLKGSGKTTALLHIESKYSAWSMPIDSIVNIVNLNERLGIESVNEKEACINDLQSFFPNITRKSKIVTCTSRLSLEGIDKQVFVTEGARNTDDIINTNDYARRTNRKCVYIFIESGIKTRISRVNRKLQSEGLIPNGDFSVRLADKRLFEDGIDSVMFSGYKVQNDDDATKADFLNVIDHYVCDYLNK